MDKNIDINEKVIKPLLITRFTDMCYGLFELVAVVLLAALAVITVSEMVSRESFRNSVSGKIMSLNSDLASSASLLNDKSLTRSFSNKRDATVTSIKEFEDMKGEVSALINAGVDYQTGTLKELINKYQQATARFDVWGGEENDSDTPESSSTPPYDIGFIYEMRSDHLLALSIICCSALGALIFGLRSGARMNVRTLTSGLATGFVVYLALKGGQHLFLITSSDVRIPSNPYSSAFAGLLAGLFSDRAYKVLSSVVDGVASRVENGTTNNDKTTSNDKKG